MLFNSYQFLFAYLPIVAIGFFLIAKVGYRYAALWLALASIFFYGWWNPQFLILLLGSIIFNYAMGYYISQNRSHALLSKRILISAIVSNLALLAYFKYTNFFITTVNQVTNAEWSIAYIILPLGISFFTFTQISFLVDAYKGIAKEYNFVHYLLFVTYFPHLIAGPVLHHKQMMPQFSEPKTYRININNINLGLTIFCIGLFKKVILADEFSQFSDPIFSVVGHGQEPQLFEAWTAALAYTLQLYFDFSAYSDMAVGLSRIFNVNLPINFNSPYKASNIIDFWRRWHITLSTFLKDYVYIPLGGNRQGQVRRHGNLMLTMLVGGLWHGANWTFVFWGGLHGIYLVINHFWREICNKLSLRRLKYFSFLNVLLTFLAVVVAWVFFRAENFGVAKSMINGMVGLNGISLPYNLVAFKGLLLDGVVFNGLVPLTQLPLQTLLTWMPLGLIMVWAAPNSMQISNFIEKHLSNSFFTGLFVGAVFIFCIMSFKKTSPFIYFQF
jgi:alginate O-acetyltransferase complex protein AlgI